MSERNPYHDENGHYTSENNNGGSCQHSRIMQNSETNYERELSYNEEKCYQDALKVFDKVKKQSDYGTYDFNGNEITDRYKQNGYQVSIFRSEILDVLTPDEINQAIKTVVDYLDYLNYPDIGCYGEAEVSHYSNSKRKAMNIAKLFNQESILDWSHTTDKDNGKFIDNPYYDSKKKLTKEDYLKALGELKNEK